MKTLLLSEREALALEKALDLYIRLGLGQVSAVQEALNPLIDRRNVDSDNFRVVGYLLSEAEETLKRHDDGEWKLQDSETNSLTVAAFGLQAKLGDNNAAWEWACKRLHDNSDLE